MLVAKQGSKEATPVLIIDDEHLNFFALAEVLKAKGFRSVSAIDAGEALDVLERTPGISAILMDVMMPGIDGYEATRAIKSDERFAHIPLIVVTALTGAEPKQKALVAGADAFLNKPVDIDALLALLPQTATS